MAAAARGLSRSTAGWPPLARGELDRLMATYPDMETTNA